jgi:hypothetical protein
VFRAPINAEKAKATGFVDEVWITRVPWDREFHLKRRTIPALGFNVKHPFTERVELAHVDTLLGDLHVFNVTTSTYVRQCGTREVRADDNTIMRGLINTVTHFRNLAKSQVEPLEDEIEKLKADVFAQEEAKDKSDLSLLSSRKILTRYRDREALANKNHANNDAAIAGGVAAAIFGAGFVVLFVMRLAGV